MEILLVLDLEIPTGNWNAFMHGTHDAYQHARFFLFHPREWETQYHGQRMK